MTIIDGQIGTDKKGAMAFVGLADRENLFDDLSAAGFFKPARKGWYLYESLCEGALRASIKQPKSDTITLNVEQGGTQTKKRRANSQGGSHPVYKTPD